MKIIFLVCILSLVSIALGAEEKYSSKLDNVNLDEILQNKRLYNSYRFCLLDKGSCTPEGKELRSHVQEALETDCAKCTDLQRSRTDQIIGNIINEKPKEHWDELKAKYDPTGKFSKIYEDKLKRLKTSA